MLWPIDIIQFPENERIKVDGSGAKKAIWVIMGEKNPPDFWTTRQDASE